MKSSETPTPPNLNRLEQYKTALRLADIEIRWRNKALATLSTFTQQINRQHTELPNLLALALNGVLEALGDQSGAILLITSHTKELTLAAHKGLTPHLLNTLTGRHLDAGTTVLMPHLVTGSGALLEFETDDPIEQEFLQSSQLTTLVSLPLLVGAKLQGSFVVGRQRKRAFNPAELCFLIAMSQATGLALDGFNLREGMWSTTQTLLEKEVFSNESPSTVNADLITSPDQPEVDVPPAMQNDLDKLLEAMTEVDNEIYQQNMDLQILHNIVKSIHSTLNLRDVLQYVVTQTQTALNTEAAWLYLLDGDDRQLHLSAYTGLSREYTQAMSRMPLNDGLEGQVVLTNRPHFIEAVATDSHIYKIWVDREGLQALAAVPITRPYIEYADVETDPPQVIGILMAGKRVSESYVWTTRERELLTAIADQIAQAVDNAHLHAKVKEHEAEMRVGNEVLRTINDMLLEKNAFLEGFIKEELEETLAQALENLQALRNAPDSLEARVDNLQQLIHQLSHKTRETADVTHTLDVEFDKLLGSRESQPDFSTSTRPIRLEKKAPSP